MKKIEAIIRHTQLEAVKDALASRGVTGLTVMDVKGHGRQLGHKEIYRGVEYNVDLLPKTMVQVVVPEELYEPVVTAIQEAARTDRTGDGKIFVSDLAEVIRIRTGETGQSAI
jgi:nitrogen regulatory protein P-II 1